MTCSKSLLSALTAFLFFSAPGTPRASDNDTHVREQPTQFDYFPEGALVSPALLFADVVKSEAYDRAGISTCDLLLGFQTADGRTVDLWSVPNPDNLREDLVTYARQGGASLRVLKRRTLGDASRTTYEQMHPQPRIVQDPTPGNRPIAATTFALVVVEVAEGSAADTLGLGSGDIIYAVGDEKFLQINSALDARQTLNRLVGTSGGTLKLQIARCEPREDGYVLRRSKPIAFTPKPAAMRP